MNKNKKNKNIKVNKTIDNMHNSNSIDTLNAVSGNVDKNNNHKNNQ
jgi:hypothetical protein